MTEGKECIFCKIANKDIEKELEYESENFMCFLDINPTGPGHTLIVPKKHFTNMMDLPSALGGELLADIKKVAEMKLKEGFEGFNIVVNNGEAAGQLVFHSHIHLVPRKKGDKVKFKTI
ncbi:MAG: HIT family protein [archaeon]